MAESSTQTDSTSAESTTSAAADQASSSAASVDTQKVASEAQSELLKSLGFDNKDELQSLVDAHNKEVAANQTELEAKSGELDKATTKLSKAESERDNAMAQVAALKQGVDNDHLNDAIALAKADLTSKVNGVKTIDDALAGVLERNPSFKGEQGTTGTAVANQNLGGGAQIAVPDLSKISYAEATKLKLEHPDVYAQAAAKLSK
ncbi:hypothetical protein [Furfurilactobacillus milii]|uniref:Scaffolding protein n=1 Tax=Furfurilactobacillus milii TaxID=2888272 RepID=A0ABT6DFI6_9LACO|nr:hypothetical protein [Furfurilactobacillus milii]QLE67423.1 hypothetical protein LROSL2_2073 [Furfurilactobacillus rossiae]MCF6161899.1 hypothetical protein [Furfurilactobacillus milii]MCF6164279.1 hypothetical protein [Furfurilactobacillus milii]MDF9914904.1 hypothetical protein [Furfurilactobacillus milii]QLE69852.1 hypothetical protein LROSL3_2131 [Furfurilactobacillus rossiae]